MQPFISSWKELFKRFVKETGSHKKDTPQEHVSCLKFESAAVCGTGKVRTQNQDNLYLGGRIRRKPSFAFSSDSKTKMMVAVADGMGGEAHGDLASLATVKRIRKAPPGTMEEMQQVIASANGEICDMMRQYGERIGSTLTMLFLQGKTALMSNIGDSRCYLLRDGELKKISTDHTQVQQMIDMGLLTPEQAKTHKNRHKLTQHLGIFPDEMIIEPAEVEMDICEGDIFLLCSDGLTDMVDDAQIEQTLLEGAPLKEKANSLFTQAMENGGRDNITVLLAAVVS